MSEIDRLSLEVSIVGAKESIEDVNKLSEAISNLNLQLQKLKIPDLSGLQKIVDAGAVGNRKVSGGKTSTTRPAKGGKKVLKQQVGDVKQLEPTEPQETDKPNAKQKSNLLSSIKRIAIYRAIRAVLKEISKTIQETIQAVSKISPEINNTMSSITSSLQIIKGSIGSIVVNLLPIIQPILQGVATLVANITNSISQSIAVLTGQGKYLKVNTEYWKDYNSAIQGTLLSFDTFNTLKSKNSMEGVFSYENIDTSTITEVTTKLKLILSLLGAIGTVEIILLIKNGTLAKGLKEISTKIGQVSTASAILASTLGFATSVYNLIEVIQNWNSQSLVTKITAIASALAGVASVVFTILALTGVGSVKVMKALAVGLGAGASLIAGISAMRFADGGMMTGTGTMYAIAGESGAEIVAQGSQGTGVLNIEQFKVAMVQALYEYGASKGNIDNVGITIDGNKVGKMVAKSSHSEMVRQGLL